MANENKTLKTRIKLRYDSYNNWKTHNPILLSGEVAIVAVATNETPDKDISQKDNQSKDLNLIKPAILFKVGDHSTHFNDLPWASGMAADVYNWAKSAKLPVISDAEGNYVTDVEWKTDDPAYPDGYLHIAKDTISTTITPTVIDDDIVIGTSTAGQNGFTLDLKHKKELGEKASYTTSNSSAAISGSGGFGTITVPQLTVNEYGHVTTATDQTVTITMPTIPSITVKPDSATGDHPEGNEVVVLSDISASGHTITQTGVKVPTKQYVDNEIATKVAGSVQYLGLLHTIDGLNHKDGNPILDNIKNSIGKGDYYRVASDFVLKSLTTANKVQFTPDPASDTYKAVRIQEGTAPLVGIHDKNGSHRFDQNNTVTDIDRDTAEYEFADGQRTPLLVTADLEGPVIAPDPKTFDGQFAHLHPGDLLVAANDGPLPQEASDQLDPETQEYKPDGYYIVHGEEVGVVSIGTQEGMGIEILNGQSSTPTINHGNTGPKPDALKVEKDHFINGVTVDKFGHLQSISSALVETTDTHYKSAISSSATGVDNQTTSNTNTYVNLISTNKDGSLPTKVSSHKITGSSGASVKATSGNLTVEVVDYSNLLTSKNGNNNKLINENGDFIILDGGAADTWLN